jgi:hypothetical protein
VAGVAKLPNLGLLGLGQKLGIWYLRAHDAPVSAIRWRDSGRATFDFVLRSGHIRKAPPDPPLQCFCRSPGRWEISEPGERIGQRTGGGLAANTTLERAKSPEFYL